MLPWKQISKLNEHLKSVGREQASVEETISAEGFDVTIHNFTASPAGITVNFSYVAPFRGYTMEPDVINDIFEATTASVEWEVVDDLGNRVRSVGGSWGSEYYSEYYKITGEIFLDPAPVDATQLIITPVAYIWHHTITHDIAERERIRTEAAGEDGSMSWVAYYINEEKELVTTIRLEPIIINLP